jgi:hypothetical protein
MEVFNVQCIHPIIHVTDKRIISVSILIIISLISRTGATRYKDYRQQWTLTVNNPNWKVQHDTTIDASIMAPDAEHEEYKYEGGDADMKTRDNTDTHSYSEIVDKAGGCRDVGGSRRSEMEVRMDKPVPGGNVPGTLSGTRERQVDKMRTGHVRLGTEVSGDETEGQESKEQESTRTRIATELFEEELSEMGTYLTELIGEEQGKVT